MNLEDREKFLADLRRDGSLREVECQLRSRRGTVHTMLLSADVIEINRRAAHARLRPGHHATQAGRGRIASDAGEREGVGAIAEQISCRWCRTSSARHWRIIQSSAEIMDDYLDQLEPAERKDHLQSIRKNTRRMAGLMEEVLLIGSFDAGKMEFKPALLELRTFVRRLVDEVLSATDRRCPIEFLFAEMPGKIQADERLLRHIFTNLLTNAVKYSDAGRVVRFEIARAGADIVCTIRDQGIGIPEADREWLFNAFHRGRNVGDRPGTGLGLVIVKRCVDLHGGKIKVDSKLGEGTSVTVRLPIFSPESGACRRLGKPAVKRSAHRPREACPPNPEYTE